MKDYLTQLKNAKKSARELRSAPTAAKNKFLNLLADGLIEDTEYILAENKKDLEEAAGLTSAMTKRLTLNPDVIKGMAAGLRKIADLDDPVGNITQFKRMPNGMNVGRMRVPIGVILFIYESRPNVIIDAAGLCVKSGNALIARGGKEAAYSNAALLQLIQKALVQAGLPEMAVQQLEDRSYDTLRLATQEEKYIDLIIPRGRESLIRSIKESARVPVIAHERGVCHAYVDAKADIEKAVKIIVNAKTSNPSTCNSLEKALVHRDIAAGFLPLLIDALVDAQVEVRGCEEVCKMDQRCIPALAEDWDKEYLDMVLAVKIVDSAPEALDHIDAHSSGLSDIIITEDYELARNFLDKVNSASVMVNASTRLTDGGALGLGAELGISTSSIHMRGPMGLEDLTVTKYVVMGNGQIRE